MQDTFPVGGDEEGGDTVLRPAFFLMRWGQFTSAEGWGRGDSTRFDHWLTSGQEEIVILVIPAHSPSARSWSGLRKAPAWVPRKSPARGKLQSQSEA